jgi:hypothetical protein
MKQVIIKNCNNVAKNKNPSLGWASNVNPTNYLHYKNPLFQFAILIVVALVSLNSYANSAECAELRSNFDREVCYQNKNVNSKQSEYQDNSLGATKKECTSTWREEVRWKWVEVPWSFMWLSFSISIPMQYTTLVEKITCSLVHKPEREFHYIPIQTAPPESAQVDQRRSLGAAPTIPTGGGSAAVGRAGLVLGMASLTYKSIKSLAGHIEDQTEQECHKIATPSGCAIHEQSFFGAYRVSDQGMQSAPLTAVDITKNSQIKRCDADYPTDANALCVDSTYRIQGQELIHLQTGIISDFQVATQLNRLTGYDRYILSQYRGGDELEYEVTHFDPDTQQPVYSLISLTTEDEHGGKYLQLWTYDIYGHPVLFEHGPLNQDNQLETYHSIALYYQDGYLDYAIEYIHEPKQPARELAIFRLEYTDEDTSNGLSLATIMQEHQDSHKVLFPVADVIHRISPQTDQNYCLDHWRNNLYRGSCADNENSQAFEIHYLDQDIYQIINKDNDHCLSMLGKDQLILNSCDEKDVQQQFKLIHNKSEGVYHFQHIDSGLCMAFAEESWSWSWKPVYLTTCKEVDNQQFTFQHNAKSLANKLDTCHDSNSCYRRDPMHPLPHNSAENTTYTVPDTVYDPTAGRLVPVLGFRVDYFHEKIKLITLSPTATSICPEQFNEIDAPGTSGMEFEYIQVTQPLENAANMASNVIESGQKYFFEKTQMVLFSLASAALNQDGLQKALKDKVQSALDYAAIGATKEEQGFNTTLKQALDSSTDALPYLTNLLGMNPYRGTGDVHNINPQMSVQELGELICPTSSDAGAETSNTFDSDNNDNCRWEMATDPEDQGNTPADLHAVIQYAQQKPEELKAKVIKAIKEQIGDFTPVTRTPQQAGRRLLKDSVNKQAATDDYRCLWFFSCYLDVRLVPIRIGIPPRNFVKAYVQYRRPLSLDGTVKHSIQVIIDSKTSWMPKPKPIPENPENRGSESCVTKNWDVEIGDALTLFWNLKDSSWSILLDSRFAALEGTKKFEPECPTRCAGRACSECALGKPAFHVNLIGITNIIAKKGETFNTGLAVPLVLLAAKWGIGHRLAYSRSDIWRDSLSTIGFGGLTTLTGGLVNSLFTYVQVPDKDKKKKWFDQERQSLYSDWFLRLTVGDHPSTPKYFQIITKKIKSRFFSNARAGTEYELPPIQSGRNSVLQDVQSEPPSYRIEAGPESVSIRFKMVLKHTGGVPDEKCATE